jgi:hypothetical protein
MNDIGSWIWLIIVIFVVVTRILPRIIRGKKASTAPKPEVRQPPTPGPVQEGSGTSMDFETLVKTLSRPPSSAKGHGDSSPPPIEPR